MVLCVSCVGARASLDDGDGVRERCSQWLPQPDRQCGSATQHLWHAVGGDGGGGVAFVTYRRRPIMVDFLGLEAGSRWLLASVLLR